MASEKDSSLDLYSCPVCGCIHNEYEEALICWDACNHTDNTTMVMYLWTEFPFQMGEFTMFLRQAREVRGRFMSYTTWGSINFMMRTSIVVESN